MPFALYRFICQHSCKISLSFQHWKSVLPHYHLVGILKILPQPHNLQNFSYTSLTFFTCWNKFLASRRSYSFLRILHQQSATWNFSKHSSIKTEASQPVPKHQANSGLYTQLPCFLISVNQIRYATPANQLKPSTSLFPVGLFYKSLKAFSLTLEFSELLGVERSLHEVLNNVCLCHLNCLL